MNKKSVFHRCEHCKRMVDKSTEHLVMVDSRLVWKCYR